MYLARRVKGHRIWTYPLAISQRNALAWEFEPPAFCCLVRQELSGPGMCAIGKTVAEARKALIEAELLQ